MAQEEELDGWMSCEGQSNDENVWFLRWRP